MNKVLIQYIFVLAMIFSASIVAAQLPILHWAKQLEASAAPGGALGQGSKGNSIAVDIWGNVYTTGHFTGTVDFDPGPGIFNVSSLNSFSGYDIFISKLDSSGNFLWAKCLGGYSDDYAYSIAVDLGGNVYTTGSFHGGFLTDFDPGPGFYNLNGFGGHDLFISKLDSAGNFVWARQFGNSGNDSGTSLVVDSLSNVYTVGYFSGMVDFDPGAGIYNLNGSNEDLFALKLDSSGSFNWAIKIAKGISTQASCSVDLDPLGNVYIMGSFGGTFDFDPGIGIYYLTASNSANIFILKLNSAGTFIWAKKMEGGFSFSTLGQSIKIDSLCNIYTCGHFQGIADLDPGPAVYNLIPTPTLMAINIFIAKLDSSGNFNWAKSIGGSYQQYIQAIAKDNLGNVYATGDFGGTADFNPGAGVYNLTSVGGFNVFFLKLDSSGDFVWAKQLGQSIGHSIAVNFPDNVYTTGYFNGTTDFDPNVGALNLTSVSPAGNTFIHRMGQCYPTFTLSPVWACNTYTLNGQTYTVSGNYTQSLSSMYGCDSSITLSITIDHITSSVANEIACDNYTIGGQTFNLGGTYFLSFLSMGGCDSNITLNLTIKSSSSSSIAVSGCSPYILNGQAYTSTGFYTQTLANTEGCDSVLTLNLTIDPLDTSVVGSAFSLWSNAPGATYQWIDCKSNLPIAGATNQGYTNISGGSYAVIVTQFGCTDTSVCYSLNAVGVNSYSPSNFIQAFPNPTRSKIIIETLPILGASIKIINLTGQVILNQDNLNGKSFTYDLSNITNGLYILEINIDGKKERVKIMKE